MAASTAGPAPSALPSILVQSQLTPVPVSHLPPSHSDYLPVSAASAAANSQSVLGSQAGLVTAARLAAHHHQPVKSAQVSVVAPPPVLRPPELVSHVATAPPPRPSGGTVGTVAPQPQQPQPPPAAAVSSGPPPGIPPLTDVQKRIVAEFKAKISNLPPERQQAYIAQNKMNLIRRLNFQPSQLQILQGGRSQLLPLAVATQNRSLSSQPEAQQPAFGVMPQPLPHPAVLQPHHPGSLAGGTMTALSGQQNKLTPKLPLPTVLPSLDPVPTTIVLPQQKSLESSTLRTIPAPVLPPPISKAKKIAWVESQIRKDQQEAVNPNYKTPFRGREDACKRLLRYHVFEESAPKLAELEAEEAEFERRSEQLVGKYHSMLSKYHILLLQESTRLCSSSEEVMLARYWEAEERGSLAREKEEYVRNNARIEELKTLQLAGAAAAAEIEELDQLLDRMEPSFPPVPPAWAAKYEQVVGRPLDTSKTLNTTKQRVFIRKAETLTPQSQQEISTGVSVKQEEEEDEDGDSDMPQLEDQREFMYRSRHLSCQSSVASPDSLPVVVSATAARKQLEVRVSNVLLRRDSSIESPAFSSTCSPGRPHSAATTGPFSPEGVGGATGATFVGLKFNRTSSGRWSASLKRDLEDDEDDVEEQPHPTPSAACSFVSKRSRTDVTVLSSSTSAVVTATAAAFNDFSDSDEDFSLADVGGGDVVQSMLDRDEEDEDDEDEEEDGDEDDEDEGDYESAGAPKGEFLSETAGRQQAFARPRTETPGSDNDSVQNAINSILDLHERGDVQTPDDLNNLTGLLDSMDDEDEDPTLDAAVKSIL